MLYRFTGLNSSGRLHGENTLHNGNVFLTVAIEWADIIFVILQNLSGIVCVNSEVHTEKAV